MRIRRPIASLIVMAFSVLATWLFFFCIFAPRWHYMPPLLRAPLLAMLALNAFALVVSSRKVFVFCEKVIRVRGLFRWREVALPKRFAITSAGEKNELVAIVRNDGGKPVLSLNQSMAPALLNRLRHFYGRWYPTVNLNFVISLKPGLPVEEIKGELMNAAAWLSETREELTLESPDNTFRIENENSSSRISVAASESNVDWESQLNLVRHLISEFESAGYEVEVDAAFSDLL